MSSVQVRFPQQWLREWPLGLAVLALVLALVGKGWTTTALGQPVMLIALLLILCGVILAAAIAMVRHAEILAHRLGEPLGTLLLTLTITGLEVAMVAFVMSTGVEKPTLARDTMFAVVMLVLDGFIGLTLLLGLGFMVCHWFFWPSKWPPRSTPWLPDSGHRGRSADSSWRCLCSCPSPLPPYAPLWPITSSVR